MISERQRENRNSKCLFCADFVNVIIKSKETEIEVRKGPSEGCSSTGGPMGEQTRAPALAPQRGSTGHLGEELVMLCSGWCL